MYDLYKGNLELMSYSDEIKGNKDSQSKDIVLRFKVGLLYIKVKTSTDEQIN